MSALAAAWLSAALLAAPPPDADEVGDRVERILAQKRYSFCAEGNQVEPYGDDRRWCTLASDVAERCPGFVEVCGRGLDGFASGDFAPGERSEKEKRRGEANRGAYEESEPLELPNLGIFAKLLMWLLLIGGAAAIVWMIVKNLVRDREDDDEPEIEPDLDAGDSLIAARAAAMRAVETDVQRLLARAEQAAAKGDYLSAINDVYAALLRRLEGEQLISVERWKTNGDYLGELRSHALREGVRSHALREGVRSHALREGVRSHALREGVRSRSPLRDEVREIVREVEQVQFGAAVAEQGRYATLRSKVLAVVGRTVLALGLLFGLGCPLFDKPDELANSAALAGLGTSPSGKRAVGELLLNHGIEARHRTRSIEQLTAVDGAIILLDDVELVDEDWDTLLTWVEQHGGTLIIATGKDFPRRLGIMYQLVDDPSTEIKVASYRYEFAGLTLAAPAGRVLDFRYADPLLLREQAWSVERPYVARTSLGSGEVVVFAEPDMLTNVGIAVADNATFLVSLLHSRDIEEVEFVDRYTGSGPDDPFESMANAKLGGLFLQILVFLALLYAAVGIPFARLRDPERQRRRSFVEHVRTLGQRYAQARAARYVAGLYSAWALDRLRDRLSPGAARGLHPLAQAIAARTGRDEKDVMHLLVAAQDVRETSEHSIRGVPADLELMRQLAKLLDETGGKR